MTSTTGPRWLGRLALFAWVMVVVCFIVGTWGGRPHLLSAIPGFIVIYIISAARARQQQTPP